MKERLELLIREGKSLSGSEKNVVFLNVADEGRRFVEVSAASGLIVLVMVGGWRWAIGIRMEIWMSG